MIIKSIEAFFYDGDDRPGAWCFRKTYLFVRIETISGCVGWGEVHTLKYREAAAVAMVAALADWLIGKDASNTKALLDLAANTFGEQRAGIDVYCATSAIEIACWDIVGQTAGLPIYQLIGGTCHDAIPVYANIFSNRPTSTEAMAAKAVEMVKRGFTTLKFYPFWSGETVAQGIEKVRIIRDAVGPDIDLAVDLWRQKSPDEARAVCHALEPYNLAWVEDAIAPINTKTLVHLNAATQQPLMTGETLAGKVAFRDLLSEQAVGLINPDVCACGGILEMREIASMAEPHQIGLSLHNYNSMTVGLAASLHAGAGMPNLHLCEYFPELEADMDAICDNPMRAEGGMISLPTKPGLGLSLHAEKLRHA